MGSIQLQASLLVADDIMDRSLTRRGQPCWYKNEGVGNIAINDAFLLEAAIYQLLKSHFRKELYYVDLLELFHDVSLYFYSPVSLETDRFSLVCFFRCR
jgi:farnesyl diphosphate synthase